MLEGGNTSRQATRRLRQKPGWLPLLLVYLFLGGTVERRAARAQEAGDPAPARAHALYIGARNALARGDHATAIRGFKDSYSAYPFPKTARKIAATYEEKYKLSQLDEDLVASFEYYEKFLEVAALGTLDAVNTPSVDDQEAVQKRLGDSGYRLKVCRGYKHLAEGKPDTELAAQRYERSYKVCPTNMLYSLYMAARINRDLGHGDQAEALCTKFTEEAGNRGLAADAGVSRALNDCSTYTAARQERDRANQAPVIAPSLQPSSTARTISEPRTPEKRQYINIAPLDYRRPTSTPPAEPPSFPPQASAPTVAPPAPQPEYTLQPAAHTPTNHGRNLKRAGTAFLVIGAVGVAFGGVIGLAAYGLQSNVQQEYERTGIWTPDLSRRAELADATWPVCYITLGTGAGVMLFGGLLYWAGNSTQRQHPNYAGPYTYPARRLFRY